MKKNIIFFYILLVFGAEAKEARNFVNICSKLLNRNRILTEQSTLYVNGKINTDSVHSVNDFLKDSNLKKKRQAIQKVLNQIEGPSFFHEVDVTLKNNNVQNESSLPSNKILKQLESLNKNIQKRIKISF